ncbi:hypothetical protein OIU89_26985 [Escherichia coli]|nr:hypothetical protein [Escherichia coli]
MMGHHLNVFIGVALNVSDQPIEFKEALCGSWDVAAVTTWPLNVLGPARRRRSMWRRSRSVVSHQRLSVHRCWEVPND